ncbi:MAG: hypothetical protein EBS01_12330, partial [Verrucomicrobia bacterium]|nr:hypothetical protein [Verrucomicrobiota bacterium]
MDGGGNVYVADQSNHLIRRITPSGVVTTLAGVSGNSGVTDGPANSAKFYNPSGLGIDSDGNVFVADQSNHAIRKITPAGVVSTFAGSGTGAGGSGDGQGTAARFNNPYSLSVDREGNVYVADLSAQLIRKISPAGYVSTIGGVYGSAAFAVEGVGTIARFYNPSGVVVDANGTLYVADRSQHTIRKGAPYTIAASLSSSALGAPVDAASATIALGSLGQNATLAVLGGSQTTNRALNLSGTTGLVTLDAGGTGFLKFASNLVVTGVGSKTFKLQGSAVAELAGIVPDNSPLNKTSLVKEGSGTWWLTGASSYSGGTAFNAGTLVLGNNAALGSGSLTLASGVTLDACVPLTLPSPAQTWSGTLNFTGTSVLDMGSGPVTLTSDQTVNVVAGSLTVSGINGGAFALTKAGNGSLILSGTNFYTGVTNVTAGTLILNGPGALPVGSTLNVSGSGSVMPQNGAKIILGLDQTAGTEISDGTVSMTVGGNGGLSKQGGGTVTLTGSSTYSGKTTVAQGILRTSAINGYTTSVYNWTLFAGTVGVGGYNNATGTAARFQNPSGVAADKDGNLFVADYDYRVIRKITPAGVVTSIAGSAGNYGSQDGVGTNATFYNPTGVAVDGIGNVYVADQANHTIRKITSGGSVTTLAGLAGSAAYLDGQGSAARFYNPTGVAVDTAGNVYVGDMSNHVIRKITP